MNLMISKEEFNEACIEKAKDRPRSLCRLEECIEYLLTHQIYFLEGASGIGKTAFLKKFDDAAFKNDVLFVYGDFGNVMTEYLAKNEILDESLTFSLQFVNIACDSFWHIRILYAIDSEKRHEKIFRAVVFDRSPVSSRVYAKILFREECQPLSSFEQMIQKCGKTIMIDLPDLFNIDESQKKKKEKEKRTFRNLFANGQKNTKHFHNTELDEFKKFALLSPVEFKCTTDMEEYVLKQLDISEVDDEVTIKEFEKENSISKIPFIEHILFDDGGRLVYTGPSSCGKTQVIEKIKNEKKAGVLVIDVDYTALVAEANELLNTVDDMTKTKDKDYIVEEFSYDLVHSLYNQSTNTSLIPALFVYNQWRYVVAHNVNQNISVVVMKRCVDDIVLYECIKQQAFSFAQYQYLRYYGFRALALDDEDNANRSNDFCEFIQSINLSEDIDKRGFSVAESYYHKMLYDFHPNIGMIASSPEEFYELYRYADGSNMYMESREEAKNLMHKIVRGKRVREKEIEDAEKNSKQVHKKLRKCECSDVCEKKIEISIDEKEKDEDKGEKNQEEDNAGGEKNNDEDDAERYSTPPEIRRVKCECSYHEKKNQEKDNAGGGKNNDEKKIAVVKDDDENDAERYSIPPEIRQASLEDIDVDAIENDAGKPPIQNDAKKSPILVVPLEWSK